MPDKRKHRGPHPKDVTLFSQAQLPKLKQAIRDLSWLLSRGYPERASLKLVGDRYRLQQRQRMAVRRCACSRQAAERRASRATLPGAIRGEQLVVDGFNVLITIESALSGGFLFEGADGCYRDLASIHGSYKKVSETEDSIRLVGRYLKSLQAGPVAWLLDRPVSNSGRLKKLLCDIAEASGWDWEVTLSYKPDQEIINSPAIAVSSDSLILDQSSSWFNLTRYLTDELIPDASCLPVGRGVF